MTELKVTCHNHPDRRAIGVCVVTGEPICAECSTRIDGVNYSRQGLETLRQQRQGQVQSVGAKHRLLAVLCGCCSVVMVYLVMLFFRLAFGFLIDLTSSTN